MEIKVIVRAVRHDKNAIYASDRPPRQSIIERRYVTCGESIGWARRHQPVGGIDRESRRH